MKPVTSQGREEVTQRRGRLGPGRGWLRAALPSGRRVKLPDNTWGAGSGERGQLPSELSYPHLPLPMKHHPHFSSSLNPFPPTFPSVTSISSRVIFTRMIKYAILPGTVLVYCRDITINSTSFHVKVSIGNKLYSHSPAHPRGH